MRRLFLPILTLFILFDCQKKRTICETKNVISTVRLKSNDKTIISKNQNCEYANNSMDLGKGLIIVPDTFEIFNDSLLKVKYATINIYNDFDKIDFCSYFYKPDYGIMYFSFSTETSKSYKVWTGNSEFKYLPKSKKYVFRTWNDHILNSFGIRRLTNQNSNLTSNQHLRYKPTENSKILTIPSGHEMFCPIEIKGDWVKVNYDCFYNQADNPFEGQSCSSYIGKCKNPLTGWIKWRKGNKLLIDIFLMP